MEQDNYNIYAKYPCRDIPIETLKGFILTFLFDASKDMGCVFDKDNLVDRVHYIITTHYNHLPLNLIASACKKGALGQYGAGRLVPRTVYGWLAEINQYYLTIQNKKDESYYKVERFMQLDKYPLGQALCKKIDWLRPHAFDSDEWNIPGIITEDEYDRIDLKQLARMIGEGRHPTPSDFGIESKI